MRILHLVHQYPPDDLGGTELYTQQLAAAQAARGHAVAVFFPRRGAAAELERWTEPAGTQVFAGRLPAQGAAARAGTLIRSGLLAAPWRTALEAFQPELVHIQHLLGLPVALLTTVRQRGLPTVITLHDYWWRCANAQLLTNDRGALCDGPRLWLNCGRCAAARLGAGPLAPLGAPLAPLFALRQRLLAPLLAQAGALIAPTRFVLDTYAGLGVDTSRGLVIGHGIDVPDALPPRIARTGPLRVAYIGGIAPQKGLHVLIEAVNGLPAGRVALTIHGNLGSEPAYAARLQETVGPDVRLAGRLPRAELWTTLAQTDLIVVPALWYETASLIIQEAFAAGVPVAASRLGGLTERVRHETDGLLLPPGDVATWRAMLDRLAADEPDRQRLAAGIRPVRTMADHVAAVDQVYDRLQEAIG